MYTPAQKSKLTGSSDSIFRLSSSMEESDGNLYRERKYHF